MLIWTIFLCCVSVGFSILFHFIYLLVIYFPFCFSNNGSFIQFLVCHCRPTYFAWRWSLTRKIVHWVRLFNNSNSTQKKSMRKNTQVYTFWFLNCQYSQCDVSPRNFRDKLCRLFRLLILENLTSELHFYFILFYSWVIFCLFVDNCDAYFPWANKRKFFFFLIIIIIIFLSWVG